MQNMQVKPTRLQAVTHAVVAASKPFFELPAVTPTMPKAQLERFTAQALAKHYPITLRFQDGATMSGHLLRGIGARYLFQAYHSQLFRVFAPGELDYIARTDMVN